MAVNLPPDPPGGAAALPFDPPGGAAGAGRRGRLTGQAHTTIVGETADGRFGWSIALGDLDADGVADLAVGAPMHRQAGRVLGRVYGYRGGSS